ncbi:complex I intermediate-associated protein CIA30 [Ceratobasidium sp. AG-Ba]|nr:complex I intermediate-associated protein CIA30 [Ceratobasidium sp. AG-Ba]QRW08470.1 complex I intermediate-associated protein CIA30 [Ceratobasidium sp. AG-Ba]
MRIFPPWCVSDWETVDDRVRGGKSVSELCERGNGVLFDGNLDIVTLGGAGFASQRYRFPDGPISIPLTKYTGIRIKLEPAVCSPRAPDEFTFILTTAPRPDGRIESRVNWEVAFTSSQPVVELPFGSFKATYRGSPVEPAPVLDTSKVFDVSIMCRSGFGAQAGKFWLGLLEVEAISTQD